MIKKNNNFPFFIIILCLLPVSCNRQTDNRPFLPAPDFRLESSTHGRFYLNEQRGRFVVIVFWATFCKICKQELKDLYEQKEYFTENNVVAASVLIDPENRDLLQEIMRSLDMDFPVLLDYNSAVGAKYNVAEVPVTVIIGPEGRLLFKRTGYSPAVKRQIFSKLESLVEQT